MQIYTFKTVSFYVRTLIVLAMSVAIGGCLTSPLGPQTMHEINECGNLPTYSINDLSINADLIVIGHVEKLDRMVNLDRDRGDFYKADQHYLSLGQLYQIKADAVLKGESPGAVLLFAQQEGYLHKEQNGENPPSEDIELARKNACYRPFAENHRYLLFLDSKNGLEYLLPLSLQPWRFDVTDEHYAHADSVATGNIRPGSLATLVGQIKAAINPVPTVTVVSPLSPLPSPISVEP